MGDEDKDRRDANWLSKRIRYYCRKCNSSVATVEKKSYRCYQCGWIYSNQVRVVVDRNAENDENASTDQHMPGGVDQEIGSKPKKVDIGSIQTQVDPPTVQVQAKVSLAVSRPQSNMSALRLCAEMYQLDREQEEVKRAKWSEDMARQRERDDENVSLNKNPPSGIEKNVSAQTCKDKNECENAVQSSRRSQGQNPGCSQVQNQNPLGNKDQSSCQSPSRSHKEDPSPTLSQNQCVSQDQIAGQNSGQSQGCSSGQSPGQYLGQSPNQNSNSASHL